MASNILYKNGVPETQTGGAAGATLTHQQLDNNFFALDTTHGTAVANRALILDASGDLNMNNVGRIDNCETVQFNSEVANTSTANAVTITLDTAQKQKLTCSENVTITLANPTSVGNWLLKLIGGGDYTLTWATGGGSIYWAGGAEPSWTGTAGTDIVSIYYDGTNFYCTGVLAFS